MSDTPELVEQKLDPPEITEEPQPKRGRGRPRKEVALVPAPPPEVAAKLSLLELALHRDAGIDIVERLIVMQERAQLRLDETEFNNRSAGSRPRFMSLPPISPTRPPAPISPVIPPSIE